MHKIGFPSMNLLKRHQKMDIITSEPAINVCGKHALFMQNPFFDIFDKAIFKREEIAVMFNNSYICKKTS